MSKRRAATKWPSSWTVMSPPTSRMNQKNDKRSESTRGLDEDRLMIGDARGFQRRGRLRGEPARGEPVELGGNHPAPGAQLVDQNLGEQRSDVVARLLQRVGVAEVVADGPARAIVELLDGKLMLR